MEPECSMGRPGQMEDRGPPPISTKRRKELLHLAGEMAAWLEKNGIRKHEQHLFRRMTELMFGEND